MLKLGGLLDRVWYSVVSGVADSPLPGSLLCHLGHAYILCSSQCNVLLPIQWL
jgi:hypothetical protein